MISTWLRRFVLDGALSDAPFIEWLSEPRTIVHAIESLLCLRRRGIALPAEVQPYLSALLSIDMDAVRSDARLTRIWSLTLVMANQIERQRYREPAITLAQSLEPARGAQIVQQEHLDRALATLLLYEVVQEPIWLPRRYGEWVDASVRACDALAVALLLGYGKAFPRSERWDDFVASMTPRSLPYGWLEASEDHAVAALVARA